MKRVGRFLLWCLVNATVLGLLIYSSLHPAQWAENIVVFAVWFAFSLAVVGVMGIGLTNAMLEDGEEVTLPKKPERSVPRWLDIAYDIALTVVLVANGRFVTAAAWVIANYLMMVYSGMVKDVLAKAEALEKVKATEAII